MSIEKIKILSNMSHKDWMRESHHYVDMTKHKYLDKEQALEDLKIIKKVLDENNIDFWLIGGTLVGIIRDGDLISWDDDVDVAVYE